MNIADATGASLSFTTAWTQSGTVYSVAVTDGTGKRVTSASVPLTVNLPAELAGLVGKLAYLRDDPAKYSAKDATTGTLCLFDFSNKTFSIISTPSAWPNVFYPKNPAFSPDGTLMTFAGYIDALGSEEDIFLWQVGANTPPTNLTPGSGKKNEDPKFSPDGTRIVFKRNGDLMNLSLSNPGVVTPLTQSGGVPEYSQPYFMPDGMRLLFSAMTIAGQPLSQVIDTLNVDAAGVATAPTLVADASGLQEFYPIPWGTDTFLFNRWLSATDPSNGISSYNLATSIEAALPFNHSGCNTADPFPADSQNNLVFYASDCFSGTGVFQLWIGSVTTGHTYPLSILDPGFTTTDDQVGPAYFPGP